MILHIDDKAILKADGELQYSRQRVAKFLTGNAGARVGGYGLIKLPPDRSSRPIAHYKLTNQPKTGEAP